MSGGTRSYEMARRLVAAGHDVHMITSSRAESRAGSKWFTSVEDGIIVHWKPVSYNNKMSYLKRIQAFFSFAIAAARRSASIDADVVFATSTPLTIAIPAVYVSRRMKVPMVFEVRDLWPEIPIAIGALRNPLLQLMARKLEKWAYFNSSAIVALSPSMRDGVVATGYPPSKTVIIPNSSDNDDFDVPSAVGQEFRAARTWLGDRPLITYAGTLGRINGVAYLVDLATELQRLVSDICILVVGDGLEREAIETKARRAGVLGVNFFMEQQVPKSEMPALLSATTIACSTVVDLRELQANSANKFFDALAAGKPVLLNYGGWQEELLKKTGAGLSTWKMSIKVAAEHLVECIQTPGWLESAGIQARELAQKQFDRDLLAEQLKEVLERACDGNTENLADINSGMYPPYQP